MKDYIFTIFLILCIISVIGGLACYLFYFEKDMSQSLKIENNVVSPIVENKEKNVVKNEIDKKETIENQEENVEKEENISSVEEKIDSEVEIYEKPTLDQIVNKFNLSDATKQMVMMGYSLRAIANQNKIVIVAGTTNLTLQQEFLLDNNILSTTIEKNKDESEVSAIKLLLATTLFDSVSQLKGHKVNALSNELMGDDFLSLTIENEGVQVINEDVITMQIDIYNDFSFLNN